MAKLHTIVLHKDEDVTSAIHAYLMDKKWRHRKRCWFHL